MEEHFLQGNVPLRKMKTPHLFMPLRRNMSTTKWMIGPLNWLEKFICCTFLVQNDPLWCSVNNWTNNISKGSQFWRTRCNETIANNFCLQSTSQYFFRTRQNLKRRYENYLKITFNWKAAWFIYKPAILMFFVKTNFDYYYQKFSV